MAKSANTLSAAKSDGVADTLAAAIWSAAARMEVADARDASTVRMLRKHARELVELHDELKLDEVLTTPQSNGHDPNLRDVRGSMGLDRAEG